MSAPKCYVCGSTDIRPAAPPHSSTCADCCAATGHVVSMQTAPSGGSLAVCGCGWRSTVDGPQRYLIQQTKVRLHWRDVIRRSRTGAALLDLVEIHAADSCLARDAMLGVASVAVICLNLVALAAVIPGAGK